MQTYEKTDFSAALNTLAEILGRRLNATAIDGYFESLRRYPLTPVLLTLREMQEEEERFPAPVKIIAKLKSKHMTTAQRADEPNTEWLRGKLQASTCVCGANKLAGDPFCAPCWEIVEARQWGNEIRLTEAYFLGACASLRGAEIEIRDPEIKPGLKRIGGW